MLYKKGNIVKSIKFNPQTQNYDITLFNNTLYNENVFDVKMKKIDEVNSFAIVQLTRINDFSDANDDREIINYELTGSWLTEDFPERVSSWYEIYNTDLMPDNHPLKEKKVEEEE